jgi:hypothetical protein
LSQAYKQAFCTAVLESPLPLFLTALEKHTASKVSRETARYLTIQLFQTGLQYRSLLSPTARAVLAELFSHVEAAPLPQALFPAVGNLDFASELCIIFEALDHPNLLVTDVNFDLHLFVILDAVKALCESSTGYADVATRMTEHVTPYSVPAIFSALQDEVINALSVLNFGEELSPGCLRYSKPPFSLLASERPTYSQSILQFSDPKLLLVRSATCLCDILSRSLQFRVSQYEITPNSVSEHGFNGFEYYITKSSIRVMQSCGNLVGVSSALVSRLEMSVLSVLSRIFCSGFSSSVGFESHQQEKTMKFILLEILALGRLSPRDFDISATLMDFVIADWRSKEILVNNRFVGCIQICLSKLQPELAEWLSMWSGEISHVQWLSIGGENVRKLIWDEILGRLDIWLVKGHYKYTHKWLRSLRVLLAGYNPREREMHNLECVVRARQLDLSFEEWLRNVSSAIPRHEIECFEELRYICKLWRGTTDFHDEISGRKYLCRLADS